MSPGCACSTATWIVQLSPGATSQVSALPAILAPKDGAQSSGEQADAALCLVHGRDAQLGEAINDLDRGAGGAPDYSRHGSPSNPHRMRLSSVPHGGACSRLQFRSAELRVTAAEGVAAAIRRRGSHFCG